MPGKTLFSTRSSNIALKAEVESFAIARWGRKVTALILLAVLHLPQASLTLKIHCLGFTKGKLRKPVQPPWKLWKAVTKETLVDSSIRSGTKTSMTESRSRTQKLGVDKIKDAWSHACMKCVIFWEQQCQDGLLVFKRTEESKSKSLKHLSI